MKAFGEKTIEGLAKKALREIQTANKANAKAEASVRELLEHSEKVSSNIEEWVERRLRDKERELQAAIDEATGKTAKVAADEVALARAKTFAIVDSILFAIENWATDDSPAPDITLASQATVFPVFFSQVSQGDASYYLTEVPETAIEVVRRGREFVKQFREQEHISVLDPTGWEILQPVLHSWWTRDAMPLLYGEGYEGWELEEPYTRDQMLTWRDMEMSRAMEFPLIFDGFELVKKYGDEIREETGLPNFNRQVMQTRIQAHG